MYEILFTNIDQKIELSDSEKDLLKKFFMPKKLRKKQFLLQEGDVCLYTAFVEKGVLRSYSVDEKGTEHIIQFASEDWWISDMYSFLTGEPTPYNIEALEDSALLMISRNAYDEMLVSIPKMERYLRILIQNSLIALQRRLNDNFRLSAEENYKNLVAGCNIVQRVPQHMIASFLGITPETLSRIRKKMATTE